MTVPGLSEFYKNSRLIDHPGIGITILQRFHFSVELNFQSKGNEGFHYQMETKEQSS